MPAVSTSSSLRPSTSIGVSIASRVVPATSETITRSRPRKALTSEDLPTFGRPITARRTSVLLQLLVLVLGQQLDEAVEQVAGAEPLRRRDGQRLAQPEAVEVVHERDVARRVDLVGGQHDRQAAAAQHLGHLGVAGAHARRARRPRTARRRRPRAPRAPGRGSRRRAASVSSRSTPPVSISAKRAPVPVGGELLAVARDPRRLVHDRLAGLGEPVDERGLADVRVADDGDLPHDSSSLASTASVTIWSTTSLQRQPGRVDRDRVGGGRERRVLAAAVALVAHRLLLEHDGGVGAELGGAAARALLGRRGEEDLDLGVGHDDGADVAALGDPVALAEQAPLLGDERRAHARVGRRRARRPRTPTASRMRSVTSSPSSSTRSPSSSRTLRATSAGSRGVARRGRPPRGTSPPCRGT